jgi:hypothetical protein
MELHQIRYFVAVSLLLNFTRAAEHCHVSTCADQGNSKARIRNGRRTHPQGKAAHSAYRIGKVGSANDGKHHRPSRCG